MSYTISKNIFFTWVHFEMPLSLISFITSASKPKSIYCFCFFFFVSLLAGLSDPDAKGAEPIATPPPAIPDCSSMVESPSIVSTSSTFSSPTNSAISGYEAISIDSVSNYWGGLERGNATNSNSSLIDGSINHTNWYYAVGSFKNWNPGLVCNGNIPLSTDVAGSSCGVPNVNLWIR